MCLQSVPLDDPTSCPNQASCVCSPIHTHPRATELLYVLEGQLYVGFVDTNSELTFSLRYFSKSASILEGLRKAERVLILKRV